jgi:hypothetical protein
MIAISSISAPVKASPLDVGVVVDPPSDVVTAGVFVMPLLGDVQPV